MSGMMLSRAIRWKSPYGWITSAVPSQLLPTKIAERVARPVGGGLAGSATAEPAASAATRSESAIEILSKLRTRRKNDRRRPRRPSQLGSRHDVACPHGDPGRDGLRRRDRAAAHRGDRRGPAHDP